MKKTFLMLVFAISSLFAFASVSLPSQALNGDPVKENYLIASAQSITEDVAPCMMCSWCHGAKFCVTYSCGCDPCLAAAADLLYAELCNAGCCYEIN